MIAYLCLRWKGWNGSRGLYSRTKSLNRHAFPNYANGMIHKTRVLLPFLRLAVEAIADIANAPIVSRNSLRNEFLGNQIQLAPFSGFIDGERGLADGVGEQRMLLGRDN